MNKQEARDRAAVMIAWADGEAVQYRDNNGLGWLPLSTNHAGFSNGCEYRIKPKPVEFWVNVYEDSEPCPYPSELTARAMSETSCIRVAVHMVEAT
jgi:hypothetical protein